jgi:VanZ family protein
LFCSPCNAAGLRLVLALALLLVAWQAVTPAPLGPPGLNDKLLHVLVFVALAFLADGGWPERPFGLRPFFWLLLYGAALEGAQYLAPGRTASLDDLGADAAGLLVYWLALGPLLRRWFGSGVRSETPQP